MSSELMKKLRGMNKATAENRKVPLTKAEVEGLQAKVQADNRGPSVWINAYDVNKPYRVQIPMNTGSDTEWLQYGYFNNVHVAAAVGAIASLAVFGDKAKTGEYDMELVETHPEYLEWLDKDINQSIIAAANGTGPATTTAGQSAVDLSKFD